LKPENKKNKQVSPPILDGLILAGGLSSRMGQDKGLIRFQGLTLIERTAQLLQDHCQTVSISKGKNQQSLPSDWPTIEDIHENIGPLGGILSAFEATPHHALLVVACDLPFLTPESVTHLVTHRGHSTFATAYRDSETNQPDPLFAIYEPSIFSILSYAIQKHTYSPRKVLCAEKITLLETVDHKTLENINTPDDLNRAQTYFNSG
jgi:molybdopterin-guanine dinucleotide biosynthesis protein A